MNFKISKIKVSRELFWGSFVSLLYILVAVSLHNGFKEDIWYYFMIGAFVGTFIITSFSNKNLKNNMKLILVFGLIFFIYTLGYSWMGNHFSKGEFLFENYVDWKEIYSYFAMGTVAGLMIKMLKNLLLRIK